MSSDIKLSDDRVIVEGNFLESHTADIILDHPPRRRPGANPHVPRRALVHGFNDELVINYKGDYPGGVVIQGEVKIPDKVVGNLHFVATDLLLDHPGRRQKAEEMRRALVHDFQDGLTINWDRDYPGGVTIQGEVKMPHKLAVNRIEFMMEEMQRIELPSGLPGPLIPVRRSVELEHVIAELRTEINALKARLDKLEIPT